MAKKNEKSNERRAMVEQMRADQQRKERRRSLAILGVCVLVVAGLIGTAAFVAIKDSRDKSALAKKKIDDLGASAKAADCDPIDTRDTDKNQTHVNEPEPITYNDAPPSFGPHRPSPAPFGRPFYTDDRPEVATLVHNLEHGYVVAWYDDTFAKNKTELDELEALAKKYYNAQERFIAAPWHSSDGAAFPSGKHLALTRWSADASNPGDEAKQKGNWQYCGGLSGEVVDDFFKKWPNAESPEPGLM